jgi:transcriptional regulator with XRE-family HTH domain
MKTKFGDYVRELRVNKGLTLRAAADEMGYASPYISRIESGLERPPSRECLEKMAKAYGVAVDTLIERASNRAKEAYGELVVNNPALNVLFKVVRDLPEDRILEAIDHVCKESGLDPQIFRQEILKRKISLPRLRKINEGLFAADIPPRFLSKVMIGKRAHQFLKKHGLDQDTYCPPTPIEVLLEKEEGIRMSIDDNLKMFKNGEPMELGMSHWSPHQDGIREIRINYALEKGPYASNHRFRFTVGHELFHALEHLMLMDEKERTADALHRAIVLEQHETNKKDRPTLIDRWFAAPNQPKRLTTNEDWREWQADYFSACVLMPEWSVRKEFVKRFGTQEIVVSEAVDVKRIAYEAAKEKVCTMGVFEKSLNQVFEVSVMAMAIRLMAVGLVHS